MKAAQGAEDGSSTCGCAASSDSSSSDDSVAATASKILEAVKSKTHSKSHHKHGKSDKGEH